MRKHIFYVLSFVCSFLWLGIVYMLYAERENTPPPKLVLDSNEIRERLESLEKKISEQVEENSILLNQLQEARLRRNKQQQQQAIDAPPPPVLEQDANPEKEPEQRDDDVEDEAPSKPVIPVLLFACNRVTVNKALDLLLVYRTDKEQFPIIVSQDCGHKETADVIRGYGDQIISIQQPDLSPPEVPPKEKKFTGYFKIARHYGWALNQTFNVMGYDQVIIVEDDLEVSPDFYEYFAATLPVLKADRSLWCVSAWNDNGKQGLIDENAADLLYRTDFFPGLGWMITKDLWRELGVKWPRSYWDDWMRDPAQRQERACIRPEISRTKTFGKIGVSNGLFFDKHLKYIVLNTKFVPFTVMDLSYLEKEKYDSSYIDEVYKTRVYSLEDIRQGLNPSETSVRLLYRTRENFKKFSKSLGIMDDFKSGVPRMAYRGVVSFMYKGRRVYLAPNINWRGYNPQWA